MFKAIQRWRRNHVIVKFALSQVGKGYSEQSPNGSDGDGHLWNLGEPFPDVYDCSGLVVTSCIHARIPAISRGNANDQWIQHLGGVVPENVDLQPGDIGCFMGANNVPGYAGHTGIVVSYDSKTRSGVLVNAYDTQRGVCTIAFDRGQSTNQANGLGVIGFYRPANK
jgi:hypothetical protein